MTIESTSGSVKISSGPTATQTIPSKVSLATRINQWAVILTNNAFSADFYVDDLFGSLNSVLRIVTGLLFGLGVVGFLWPMMDREFSPK